MQFADRSPIDSLLLTPLELEVAVTQDVILLVDNFYLTLFELSLIEALMIVFHFYFSIELIHNGF